MPRFFAAKLRYIRRQLGMTQGELAHAVGLASYHYMSELELGQRTPSLDLVVRLAAYVGRSTDYFLRDTIAIDFLPTASNTSLAVADQLPRLFGAKLRAFRQQHGWGQTEMARKLNLKRRGYISNLEAGRKSPSLDLTVQIADLFGVTTDFLLSGREVDVDQ